MKISNARRVMQLLKKGKKYRDGLSGIFVELYYEAPFFIHHEFNGDGFNGEAVSHRTKFSEQEMLTFFVGRC